MFHDEKKAVDLQRTVSCDVYDRKVACRF